MRAKLLHTWFVLALSSVASVAAADRGTVTLTNGGQITGELVEYAPGDHVTVDLGGGQQLTFKAAEISAVQVTNGAAPAASADIGLAAPAVQNAAAPVATDSPHVQQLLLRRHELLRRRIGFGGPIGMLAGGTAMAVIGWGVIFPVAKDVCRTVYDGSSFENRDCHWGPGAVAGAVIGSLGIALAATGVALIPSRVARRKSRAQELEAIDGELRSMGFTASVAPWLRTGPNSLIGMRATLTF